MKCIRTIASPLAGKRSRLSCSLPVLVIILLSGFAPSLKAETGAVTSDYHRTARFLAGMASPAEDPLAKRAGKKYYKRHAEKMNRIWRRIETGTISRIDAWRKSKLPPRHGNETVLYPLSGADFINMYSLFRDSKRFVMIAMEPSGAVPSFDRKEPWRLRSGLTSIRRLLYWYGAANYFTTAGMKREMGNVNMEGTLPVIMIFMARMGLQIHDIEYIQVGGRGDLVKISGKKEERKRPFSGYRLVFSDPSHSPEVRKEVIYLRAKLENSSVMAGRNEGLFLNREKQYSTLIKSAVYLLQMNEYRGLKNFIMAKSSLIVQDDSGIAYNDFNPRFWDISLYGRYRPIPIAGCRVRRQGKLAADFRKVGRPLPFQFGYGRLRGRNASNLMVIKKRET